MQNIGCLLLYGHLYILIFCRNSYRFSHWDFNAIFWNFFIFFSAPCCPKKDGHSRKYRFAFYEGLILCFRCKFSYRPGWIHPVKYLSTQLYFYPFLRCKDVHRFLEFSLKTILNWVCLEYFQVFALSPRVSLGLRHDHGGSHHTPTISQFYLSLHVQLIFLFRQGLLVQASFLAHPKPQYQSCAIYLTFFPLFSNGAVGYWIGT